MPNRVVEDALERCLDPSGEGQPLDGRAAELAPKARRELTDLIAVGDIVRRAPRPALLPPALVAIERRLLTRVAELRAGETLRRSTPSDGSSSAVDR